MENKLTSPRLAPRLARLPREVLCQLAAKALAASDDGIRRAESALAKHDPLPRWCLTDVLLSDDVSPHILGFLTYKMST